jgi:hypothetical protein
VDASTPDIKQFGVESKYQQTSAATAVLWRILLIIEQL